MKKRYFLFIFIFLIIILLIPINIKNVYADELSDSINDELLNIDFSSLEIFYNNNNITSTSFFDRLYSLINGNFSLDYKTFLEYICNLFFENIKELFPIVLTIIAICILCGIYTSLSIGKVGNDINKILNLICILTISLILFSKITNIVNNTKITIENIANLIEIMSPIILALMVASNGNQSAIIYQPIVSILTNIITNIFLYVVLPIIILSLILNIISSFNKEIKLNKFVSFFNSLVKWIIGITVTVFTLFISIQGISAASYDGISIKATKYALSNSIPIVGSFLKDCFDLLVCGSILIKNSVGICCVISFVSTILPLLIYIITFILLLKFLSAICDVICENNVSSVLTNVANSLNYFNAVILLIGFMFFVTILLMIFSANSFI